LPVQAVVVLLAVLPCPVDVVCVAVPFALPLTSFVVSGNTQIEFGPSLVYVPPAAVQSADDPEASAPVGLNAKKVIGASNNKYDARDMKPSCWCKEKRRHFTDHCVPSAGVQKPSGLRT
jgi:hypothetical protein